MRVTLIAFGSVWPILLNTIEGTRTVDPVQIDTARAYRLPSHARLWRIVLPAAMPKIFAGVRVSLALAVILMVVSELVASTNGIGYRIQNSQIMFLLTDMWCGIVLLALLGYTLNWLFLKVEDRALGLVSRRARTRREIVARLIMLTVKDLHHAYAPGQVVTQSVSFEVRAGEIVSIVGPSGCGKTTLLKCLAGLLTPTAGDIRFQGEAIRGVPQGFAMVFQEYGRSLLPWATVNDNVELPLKYRPITADERRSRVTQSLEAVGLAGAGDRYPWQLSGGMQQRVAIARAIAYQPKLLLMDEPFASVDAQTRADLEDLVATVRDQFQITIVVVTHDIDEAVYLSDRVVVLSKSPSTVLDLVATELPRPRDQIATKAQPQFVSIRSKIARLIKRPTADVVRAPE